ncbi:MAG: ectoine/hydroxyectoine ABC transporter substrate-binding protein EhuB, partial [Rhizobium ruizarguesonis]
MNAGYFLSAASLSVLLITAAAPASAADDKLEQ